MKNLLVLLALLTAVAFTACDDCAEADGGTGETTDTCSDGGVGGATEGGATEGGATEGGATEGGTPAGETPAVDCSMPVSKKDMSMSLAGVCGDDCGDGVAYNGDAACSTSGTACCIPLETIQDFNQENIASTGNPAPCGDENNGFCVNQKVNACNVDGRNLESGLCPGGNDVLCCK